MKRVILGFAVAGAAVVASGQSAFADQHFGDRGERGFATPRLERCLAALDLTADQRSAIEAIVQGAKTNLQADAAAVRADRQKLKADLDAGADKSVVGQDVLTAHADRQKLRSDALAVRDQIGSKLSADQQSQLKGCFRGPRSGGAAHTTS